MMKAKYRIMCVITSKHAAGSGCSTTSQLPVTRLECRTHSDLNGSVAAFVFASSINLIIAMKNCYWKLFNYCQSFFFNSYEVVLIQKCIAIVFAMHVSRVT